MKKVIVQWHVLELEFHAHEAYRYPHSEVKLEIAFISPQGKSFSIPGFWDGGDTWKARFAPPSIGEWDWESVTVGKADSGLSGLKGCFTVFEYQGENLIYKHGFLKVNDNNRGFAHDDGTPFFWLGDTAWAMAKANTEEWREYIEFRSAQGFNMVQVNSLRQFDSSKGQLRKGPFPNDNGNMEWNCPNSEYFQHMDELMQISLDKGLFTAMVVLWFNYVPGANASWDVKRENGLTPELAYLYGRYLAARFGAYGTIWIISGDTDFTGDLAIETYDAAAHGIKDNTPYHPLITAHMHGGKYTPENMNNKDWLAFHMYQSCHVRVSVKSSLNCAKVDRQYTPVRPVLNGEPCYEYIGYYKDEGRVSREFARETGWKSILGGGNAGITYGAHGIWCWHCEGDHFPNEDAWKMPASWEEALHFKGAEDYARMKRFFTAIPWWKLEPSNNLINSTDPDYTAASTPEGDLILVYVSSAKEVEINIDPDNVYTGVWFNPITDERYPAILKKVTEHIKAERAGWDSDALLVMTKLTGH